MTERVRYDDAQPHRLDQAACFDTVEAPDVGNLSEIARRRGKREDEASGDRIAQSEAHQQNGDDNDDGPVGRLEAGSCERQPPVLLRPREASVATVLPPPNGTAQSHE